MDSFWSFRQSANCKRYNIKKQNITDPTDVQSFINKYPVDFHDSKQQYGQHLSEHLLLNIVLLSHLYYTSRSARGEKKQYGQSFLCNYEIIITRPRLISWFYLK